MKLKFLQSQSLTFNNRTLTWGWTLYQAPLKKNFPLRNSRKLGKILQLQIKLSLKQIDPLALVPEGEKGQEPK